MIHILQQGQFSPHLRAEVFGEGPTPQLLAAIMRDGNDAVLAQTLAYPSELADLYTANGLEFAGRRLAVLCQERRGELVRSFEGRSYHASEIIGPALDDYGHVVVGMIAKWRSSQRP